MQLRQITNGFLRASSTYRATLRKISVSKSGGGPRVMVEFEVNNFLEIINVRNLSNLYPEEELRSEFDISDLFDMTLNSMVDPRGSDLLAAVKSEDLDVFRELLALNVDLDARMDQGATLLHIAAHNHFSSITEFLLNAAANPNIIDDLGWTPFLIAAMHSDVSSASMLLNAGADRSARFENATALDMAMARKDSIMIPILKPEPEPDVDTTNVLTENDRLQIFSVAVDGNRDCVTELIDSDPSILDLQDEHGYTTLHIAAKSGQKEIVEFLLSRYASIDLANNFDSPPLTTAAQFGNSKIVELLLDDGADLEHNSSGGATALHLATQQRNQRLVEILLDRGADINCVVKNGDTVLHVAVRDKQFDLVELIIEHGANIDVMNVRKSTPLSIAHAIGLPDFVELLVKHGAGSDTEQESDVEVDTPSTLKDNIDLNSDGSVGIDEKPSDAISISATGTFEGFKDSPELADSQSDGSEGEWADFFC
jgi:ankyrin repeat protein